MHAADIVRQADRVEVEADKAQPSQRRDQRQTFMRRHAAPGRRAHARRAGRVKEIHVEAQIDRPAGKPLTHFPKHILDATLPQLDAGDHAVLPMDRLVERVLLVGRSACADMQRMTGIDQPLVRRAGEGRSRIVAVAFARPVVGIGIGMRVDMQDAQIRMYPVQGSQLRQAD